VIFGKIYVIHVIPYNQTDIVSDINSYLSKNTKENVVIENLFLETWFSQAIGL
jgi:hypothetical protein